MYGSHIILAYLRLARVTILYSASGKEIYFDIGLLLTQLWNSLSYKEACSSASTLLRIVRFMNGTVQHQPFHGYFAQFYELLFINYAISSDFELKIF